LIGHGDLAKSPAAFIGLFGGTCGIIISDERKRKKKKKREKKGKRKGREKEEES
jgi:hypothetical protein